MSKLYINDLENIVNGGIKKFNLVKDDSKKIISLDKLTNQIKDLRYIRNYILDTFKQDTNRVFDIPNGSMMVRDYITYDNRKMFEGKYLSLGLSTILGDNYSLISENGLVSTTFDSNELREKLKLLDPYIKGLINIKKESNILDNEFYETIGIYNFDNEKVLNLSGDGVFLPFEEYKNISENEKQELLAYYYTNWDKILENIIIPDATILNRFRTDVSKQKALALYNKYK